MPARRLLMRKIREILRLRHEQGLSHDPVEGCLRTASHLIHDRDPLYTRVFAEILTGARSKTYRFQTTSNEVPGTKELSACLNGCQ